MAPRRKNIKKNKIKASNVSINESNSLNNDEVIAEKLANKTMDLMKLSTSTDTDLNFNVLNNNNNNNTYSLRSRVSLTPKVDNILTENLEKKIVNDISNLNLAQETSNDNLTINENQKEQKQQTNCYVITKSLKCFGLEEEFKSEPTSPISSTNNTKIDEPLTDILDSTKLKKKKLTNLVSLKKNCKKKNESTFVIKKTIKKYKKKGTAIAAKNKTKKTNNKSIINEANIKEKTNNENLIEKNKTETIVTNTTNTSLPLPVFQFIEDSLILCDDAVSRESKAIRCNCTPSDEDLLKGRGCGDDCINRLLFMECGSRCPSGKYCTNKRFQKHCYSEIEIFDAGKKGWGLKAKSTILKGQFIIEYIGEVVDVFEMAKRMKRYGKNPEHKHHYFMALRNGAVIDATTHGNYSRFINHSCDPNAVTQKWTVNRQLRIGFFALKTINAGDEIVFNYQFERYGKKAQECYCGSSNCTGYIGINRNDDNESEFSSESSSLSEEEEEEENLLDEQKTSSIEPINRKNEIIRKKLEISQTIKSNLLTAKNKKQPHTRHRRHHELNIEAENERKKALELSEVSEMLNRGTLRNKEQVLEFNRLMVRVDNVESRQKMIEFLLNIEDPVILRLFVENQGLSLIRIWFLMPAESELTTLQIRSNIMKLLLRLPITSKNQIDEASILPTLNHLQRFELSDETIIEDCVEEIILKVCNEQPLSATITSEFKYFKTNLNRVLNKWSLLSYFKIPKKVSNTLINSTTTERNASGSIKYNNFTDMVIESDDELLDQDPSRPWSSNSKYNNSRFTYNNGECENEGDNYQNFDSIYKGYNHIGVIKITPNVSSNSVNKNSSSTCFVPPVQMPNFLYPPLLNMPHPSTINSALPLGVTLPPVGIPPHLPITQTPANIPPISPFSPIVMYPPPHMIMQAHAAVVAANNQNQIIPPPPPPPIEAKTLIFSENKTNKRNNQTDNLEQNVSINWFKLMAEEAASVALKANASLNTKKNNKKETSENNENKKTKKYIKKRYSVSRSSSRSTSRSRSLQRRKHKRNRKRSKSRSKSRTRDYRGSNRLISKRLLSMTSATSYYLNRKGSKHNKNDKKHNERRSRSRSRSRSSKRNISRSRKSKSEKDKRRKSKENDHKLENKEKENENKNENDSIIKPLDENSEKIKKSSIEEKHFAHFYLPISSLENNQEVIKNNNKNSESGVESDTGSASSVEQLKKSVRNSVKLNKVLGVSQKKNQLTININCNKTFTTQTQISNTNLEKKDHISPVLISNSSNNPLNAEKILTLPPPPLPPDLLINKNFKTVNKEDGYAEFSDSNYSASTSSSRSSKLSNINCCLNNPHKITNENEINQTSNKLIVQSIEKVSELTHFNENILLKGPSLLPEFSPDILSSTDSINNYVNKLADYIESIRSYMNLLTEFKVKKSQIKTENVIKSEFNFIKETNFNNTEVKNLTNNNNEQINTSIKCEHLKIGHHRKRGFDSKTNLSLQNSQKTSNNEIDDILLVKRSRTGETTTPPEDPISTSSCRIDSVTNNYDLNVDASNTNILRAEPKIESLSSNNNNNVNVFDLAVPSTSDDSIKDIVYESNYKQNNINEDALINQSNETDFLINNNQEINKMQKDNKLNAQNTNNENIENVAITYVEKIVSKSGNWLATKDADGNVYYFHKITREAAWELPADEKVENSTPTLINRNEKRAEFKRQVSDFVSRRMEPYRKRFFSDSNDFIQFLRKITHKVIDNQDKCNNHELKFTETVRTNTKRLVDDYIRLFKSSRLPNSNFT